MSAWTSGSTLIHRGPRHPHLRAWWAAVRRVARNVTSSNVAWVCIGALVAAISLWQGFGFAVGGASVSGDRQGWAVLLRILPAHSLRTHGVIMAMLGFALAVDLDGGYTARTKWVLRLLRTYCLVVACCWIVSWTEYGITWGPPGWWLLLSALTVWMTYFAPTQSGGGRA